MSDSKKLNEKELESVNGGLYRRLPTSKSVSGVTAAPSLPAAAMEQDAAVDPILLGDDPSTIAPVY